jgi:hypothetical protein
MDAGTILLTVIIIRLALMTHVPQLQVVPIAPMSALWRTNVILSPVTTLLALFKVLYCDDYDECTTDCCDVEDGCQYVQVDCNDYNTVPLILSLQHRM